MKSRLLVLLAVTIFLGACTGTKLAPIGDSPPVITAFYASPTIQAGWTWKVYIKAHDPDGDMAEAVFNADQVGVLYNPEILYLQQDMYAKINGYFTAPIPGGEPLSLNKPNLVLSVTIRDRGGRESQTVKFPLSIGLQAQQPAPESFADKYLGRVPIIFRRGGSR